MSCSIDWAATGQMISGISTFLGALAIIGAAWIGRSAFADYREQKKIDRQINVADDVLATAHQLRFALSDMRNTSSGGYDRFEAEASLQKQGASDLFDDATVKRMIIAKMVHLRADKHGELFERAQKVLAYSMAYFSDTAIPDNFRALAESYRNILVWADVYIDDGGKNDEIAIETMRMIFAGNINGSADTFGEEINAAINNLESELFPVIRSGIKFGAKTKVSLSA